MSLMGQVMPLPRVRHFDANGDPLAGGTLEAYAAGTTTPVDTFTDSDLATPHAWPVVLDANGLAPAIYLSPATSYKFILKDATGVVVWTQDEVALAPISDLEAVQDGGLTIAGQAANDLVSAVSASQLGVIHAVANAVLTTGSGGAPAWQTWSLVRRLHNGVTPASNSGTGETDLQSYTLPANTLDANGAGLEIIAYGTSANNSNTKTIRLYIGGTAVFTTTIQTGGTPWRIRARLHRTGAATEVVTADATGVATTGVAGGHAALTADLTAAVAIKVTGQSSAAGADITQTAFSVVLVP